jgi:hypothetical protein
LGKPLFNGEEKRKNLPRRGRRRTRRTRREEEEGRGKERINLFSFSSSV